MPFAVSNTTYGIIRDAMQDAGMLQEGDDPNSEQLATYMRRLCDIINLWQTEGLKLFLLQEVTVTLIAGQAEYTLNQAVGVEPNKNLRVIQGRIENSNSSRPIYSISWDEWNRLQKNNTGCVTGYFVDKQVNSLVVHTWNTPDANEALNVMILLVQTQVANPYNLTSDVMFPQEWRIALRWGLADDICTGQPQAIMDRCQQRAQLYKTQLEDWDVEDTPVRFAVDPQMTMNNRRIR
jgi:hypothetical protein